MSIAAGAAKRPPESTVSENRHGKPTTRASSAERNGQNAQVTSYEDASISTSSANPVLQGAPLGPSPALLHEMLNAANESSKLVTLQCDNLAM